MAGSSSTSFKQWYIESRSQRRATVNEGHTVYPESEILLQEINVNCPQAALSPLSWSGDLLFAREVGSDEGLAQSGYMWSQVICKGIRRCFQMRFDSVIGLFCNVNAIRKHILKWHLDTSSAKDLKVRRGQRTAI